MGDRNEITLGVGDGNEIMQLEMGEWENGRTVGKYIYRKSKNGNRIMHLK